MATLRLERLRKSYGATAVVHGVDLDVGEREFVVLVGPSGCGKSTILRMIAGLEDVTGGEIRIDDRVVNEIDPKDRDIAMVFQDYALYPHMSVWENIAFSLKYRGVPKAQIKARVDEAARILDIAHLLDRMPRHLSGGQRQRVAMGRAIVRKPKIFLFDEPLSNLDAKLRVAMRTEIKALRQRVPVTTIYVTHDQVEAMTLADRIVILDKGVIEQIGTPEDVYDRPATTFVASFIGAPAMNLLPGVIEASGVRLENGSLLPMVQGGSSGLPVFCGLRPEHLVWSPDGGQLEGTAGVVEPLGSDTLVTFGVAGAQVMVRLPPKTIRRAGETVRVSVAPENVHLFDRASGRRL